MNCADRLIDEYRHVIDLNEDLINYIAGLASLCASNEETTACEIYQLLAQARLMATNILDKTIESLEEIERKQGTHNAKR